MADQGSEGLLSGFLRQQRVRAALPFLRGRILDFGCGSGALATSVPPGNYLGIDADPEVVSLARHLHPGHTFQAGTLPSGLSFDTVVSLAVIEHLKDPAAFLKEAASVLAPDGTIVLTTPHPAFHSVHDFGARLGLFSRAASEEHETLLDQAAMHRISAPNGLRITHYRRFLLGANQLFLLKTGLGNGSRKADGIR